MEDIGSLADRILGIDQQRHLYNRSLKQERSLHLLKVELRSYRSADIRNATLITVFDFSLLWRYLVKYWKILKHKNDL